MAVDARRAAWWARAMPPGVRPVGGVLGVRPERRLEHRRTAGGRGAGRLMPYLLARIFFCLAEKKNPNSQRKFLFVNSEIFFCKKKMSYRAKKVRHVGFQVHQESSKSARIGSGKKLGCLLFVSACGPKGVRNVYCKTYG